MIYFVRSTVVLVAVSSIVVKGQQKKLSLMRWTTGIQLLHRPLQDTNSDG